ncbi:hypothetical protein MRX96_055041, partial [Rhipicephalus microplus]
EQVGPLVVVEAALRDDLSTKTLEGCSHHAALVQHASSQEKVANSSPTPSNKWLASPPELVKLLAHPLYNDQSSHDAKVQFRTNFHLARSPCYELIKQFEPSEFHPSDRNHGGVPVKTPEEHILSFLWYAVNKASMREVAVLFDMAESTQFAVTDRVLGFLCKIAPDVIHFVLDKDALARDFEKMTGFPGVIGYIDGTYIPMRCPANKQRFRQLRYIEFTKVDKITQFISACCVLHNICLDSGDTGVEDLLTEEKREEIRQDALLQIRKERAELDQNRQPQTDRESVLRRLGELKRNALMQQL